MNYLEKLWTLTLKERKQFEEVLEVLRKFHKCEDLTDKEIVIVEKVANEYREGYTSEDLKQNYMELLTECYELEHLGVEYMNSIDIKYDRLIETLYGNMTTTVLHEDILISSIHNALGFTIKDLEYEIKHHVLEIKKLYK